MIHESKIAKKESDIKTHNMVELDEQIGFIIVHKETKKRIGFRLSGKSKGVKSIWSKIGLAKSAFCYHTGIIFAEQTYYEIKEIK